MKKEKCITCDDEGVCWLLSPCPDCKEGRKVDKIGKKLREKFKKSLKEQGE